eukprot:1028468-Pleurochrysis_carterae.AAC.1
MATLGRLQRRSGQTRRHNDLNQAHACAHFRSTFKRDNSRSTLRAGKLCRKGEFAFALECAESPELDMSCPDLD